MALVFALTGGAYAAGGIPGHARPAKNRAPKPLTKAQIISLIDNELKLHPGPRGHTGPPGPAGAPGQNGAPGGIGPAGPGAKLYTFDSTSPQATTTPVYTTLATVDGITLEYACSSSGSTVYMQLDGAGPAFTADGFDTFAFGGVNSTTPVSSSFPSAGATTPDSLVEASGSGGTVNQRFANLTVTGPGGSSLLAVTEKVLPGSTSCHLSVVVTPVSTAS